MNCLNKLSQTFHCASVLALLKNKFMSFKIVIQISFFSTGGEQFFLGSAEWLWRKYVLFGAGRPRKIWRVLQEMDPDGQRHNSTRKASHFWGQTG